MTVAALVALGLAVLNVAGYLLGPELARDRPGGRVLPVVVYSALLLGLAWGLWRTRYWAVVGVQAALVVLIVVFSLLALTARNLLGALLALMVIAAAGTLFWFLVRAMARIQAPRRS